MGITIVLVSLASMGGVGIALAFMLAVADKKLAVKEDPRVERALDLLPGANCGACGFAGCAAYAAALVEEKVSVNECKPGEIATKDHCVRRVCCLVRAMLIGCFSDIFEFF